MEPFDFENLENPPNEEELIERSMINGYKVLSSEITIDELLFTSGIIDLVYLPFDFYQLLSVNEFSEIIQEDMVKYFEEREEFEKCKFLKSMKYSDYCLLFNEFFRKI
tara:strand:- start:574 stop:897 length:324 start_codon:yes stop_codon:yes gene_type:complete